MFSLVSARYERGSGIVTSTKPFSAWGEIFARRPGATVRLVWDGTAALPETQQW
jgi:DNA replication protein DnaC